jgi:hypothetical protein
MEVMAFLNQNAGALQAISTSVLVAVTIIYVYLTNRIAKEAREQNRPYVFIDFDINDGSLDLAVANSGNRIASNVRFKILTDIGGRGGAKVSEIPVIKNGITHVPPGRTFLYSFDYARSFFDAKNNGGMKFVYEVSYKHGRKPIKDKLEIDLSAYKDVLFRSFKNTESVLKEGLQDISQNMRSRPQDNMLSRFKVMTEEACPVCKESIKKGALKCRFCGEWLKEKAKA